MDPEPARQVGTEATGALEVARVETAPRIGHRFEQARVRAAVPVDVRVDDAQNLIESKPRGT
jgi:hypothetical protein